MGAPLLRLRLDVAYDGAAFSGWARQPSLRTVQGDIEAALAQLLRLDSVAVTCAGRTDAGVHARGQVCHVDVPAAVDPGDLRRRLARMLRDDVRVTSVTVAPAGFDARFSAIWRRYAYRIADDAAEADPLRRHFVLTWRRRLDVDDMNAACKQLIGEHDFAAYCRPREAATTVRTLHELGWTRGASGELVGVAVADAFCHSMVRSLVGAAIGVGEGRIPVDGPRRTLDSRLRDPRMAVVAAHGLTLEAVGYPHDDELAVRAAQARSRRSEAAAT